MKSFDRSILTRALMTGAALLALTVGASAARADTVIGANGMDGANCSTDGCMGGNGTDGKSVTADGDSGFGTRRRRRSWRQRTCLRRPWFLRHWRQWRQWGSGKCVWYQCYCCRRKRRSRRGFRL